MPVLLLVSRAPKGTGEVPLSTPIDSIRGLRFAVYLISPSYPLFALLTITKYKMMPTKSPST